MLSTSSPVSADRSARAIRGAIRSHRNSITAYQKEAGITRLFSRGQSVHVVSNQTRKGSPFSLGTVDACLLTLPGALVPGLSHFSWLAPSSLGPVRCNLLRRIGQHLPSSARCGRARSFHSVAVRMSSASRLNTCPHERTICPTAQGLHLFRLSSSNPSNAPTMDGAKRDGVTKFR